MAIKSNRGSNTKSVIIEPINRKERKRKLLSMIKELIKGYYLILLVGVFCILLLIVIMRFA